MIIQEASLSDQQIAMALLAHAARNDTDMRHAAMAVIARRSDGVHPIGVIAA